jgi:hypothetical protein
MVLDENKENIKRACYERIISIYNSRLNFENLFKAINEFALSKLNYCVGIKMELKKVRTLEKLL